nr:increased DNA methylation 1-like [Tanacetum cinerariifolium]
MGGSVFKKSKKNEVFLCNRPMKQIQDLQKLILWRGGVLRSLIENNIVERGSTVSYLTRKHGRVMKKGRVYKDGIKCDCCNHMFLLTTFELHAGSTKHRAAANLFFDDKRSILDCQTQLQTVLPADNTKSVVTDVKSTKSSDYVIDTNDDYCSFCNDMGELLLCDSCTSSFHQTYIGLDRLPDSDLWLCCACGYQICHQGQPSSLTKEGDSKVCADDAKWFCTENFERIYLGLIEIRGKVIPLKGNNLNWSLLKYDENDTDVNEYKKLMKALDVMQKCFKPVKYPLSDKDMIEDVIFSRAIKRSNFEGFYTAVLEKNDEIITVVTLRVHGYKVAEIPFVTTTLRYRRLGMCRMLMDEVERMIRGLGVEIIVLPASTDKVSTWTQPFGFSEMTDIERRNVNFLNFWERPGKDTQKGGNLRKGQATGNSNGAAMEKGSQTKNHLNFLSGDSDLIPTLRGGGWDGGSYDYRSRDEGTFYPSSPSSYNGIIGRQGVRKIQAVPSMAHGMLKFPMTGGTVMLWTSRIILLECTTVLGLGAQQPIIDQVTEEKIQVETHLEYQEQTIAIGFTLTEEGRKKLCSMLRHNLDIFA